MNLYQIVIYLFDIAIAKLTHSINNFILVVLVIILYLE